MKELYRVPETEVVRLEITNAILDMSMGGELAPPTSDMLFEPEFLI